MMLLLRLLLWWAGLSSLNAFVVCSEKTTSFTRKLTKQQPSPYPNSETWRRPKDCLFLFETGILSWSGGFSSGDLFKRTGQAGKENWYLCSCHVLARPCSRQESKVFSSLSQVMIWGSWCQRFGSVIGGSLLPTGARTCMAPRLYAAQESFDHRVWRVVSSCIRL